MDKRPLKIALFDARDYGRDSHTAYPTIRVEDEDFDGDYRWMVRIQSYAPIGWTYQGETRLAAVAEASPNDVRPWAAHFPDAPFLALPAEVPVRQAQFVRMTPDQRAEVVQLQRAWRRAVDEATALMPQAVTLIEETPWSDGLTKDDADAAAQEWTIAAMQKYAIGAPVNKQSGHALIINPFGAGPGAMILDALTRLMGRDWVVRTIRKSRTWREFVAMAIAYASTARNSRLNVVRDALDAGAGAALHRFYTASRPATGGTATTLLAELTFGKPSASNASGGVLTMNAITADSSANATGTTTWFRDVDSAATFVIDGDCGTSGSDCNLNSTSISSGQQVSLSSFTITAGNA